MTEFVSHNVAQPRRFCCLQVSREHSNAVLDRLQSSTMQPDGWTVGWWDQDQNTRHQHHDYEFFRQTGDLSAQLVVVFRLARNV